MLGPLGPRGGGAGQGCVQGCVAGRVARLAPAVVSPTSLVAGLAEVLPQWRDCMGERECVGSAYVGMYWHQCAV